MDVKKALWIVAGIIIAAGLIVLVISLVFGTDIIQNAFNALGNYINEFWHKLTNTSVDIFEEVEATKATTIGF